MDANKQSYSIEQLKGMGVASLKVLKSDAYDELMQYENGANIARKKVEILGQLITEKVKEETEKKQLEQREVTAEKFKEENKIKEGEKK